MYARETQDQALQGLQLLDRWWLGLLYLTSHLLSGQQHYMRCLEFFDSLPSECNLFGYVTDLIVYLYQSYLFSRSSALPHSTCTNPKKLEDELPKKGWRGGLQLFSLWLRRNGSKLVSRKQHKLSTVNPFIYRNTTVLVEAWVKDIDSKERSWGGILVETVELFMKQAVDRHTPSYATRARGHWTCVVIALNEVKLEQIGRYDGRCWWLTLTFLACTT